MSSRRIWMGALLLALVIIVTAVFVDVRETASASTLSVGARGWIVTRLYLKARGREVHLVDRPLDEAEPLDVLVLTLPWQRWPRPDERRGVQEHLRRGKTVVFAYSGAGDGMWGDELADWLGLEWNTLRGEPPLSPTRWRDFATETWDLRADPLDGFENAPTLRLGALSRAPKAPANARVWYRAPDGSPVAYDFPYRGGRVVVLPADLFANAWLTEAGNVDLLETLAVSLGEGWSFDEYHHGLSAALTAEQELPRFALDLLLLHLGALYVLTIWRLARPFGPAWKDVPVTGGSTESFLLGLGALHDRLGHYRDAAELMIHRARELDPRIEIEATGDTGTGKALVELGRSIAEQQTTR